jgi:hypothetical protein
MLTERTEQMQRMVRLLVIGAALFGTVWLVQASYQWRARQPVQKLSADMDSLFLAFREYKKIVGSYPSGSNGDVARALYGRNDKNLIILIVPKCELNSKGEIIDPWATPLKFYFSANEVLIRSAGPNRVFEDSKAKQGDDYFRSD